MRKQLENPGDAEDYVDGLRQKKYANVDIETDTDAVTVAKSGNPTNPRSRVDTGIPGPLRCLVTAAVFVAGAATGAVLVASGDTTPVETVADQPVSEPRLTPNSGRTESAQPAPQSPRIALSVECKRALDGMAKYLDSAAAVAAVNDQQLDLMQDSFTAILSKDWKKLNDLAGEQREMDRALATDKSRVLPKYQTLIKDLDTCRSQQN